VLLAFRLSPAGPNWALIAVAAAHGIETWNENPQPFVWTKTADQILESIARYCTRINLTAD
jgi:hypothetical protein